MPKDYKMHNSPAIMYFLINEDVFLNILFLKYLFHLCKRQSYKDREGETERERESFYLLVHFPDGHKGQGWAKSQELLPGLSCGGAGTQIWPQVFNPEKPLDDVTTRILTPCNIKKTQNSCVTTGNPHTGLSWTHNCLFYPQSGFTGSNSSAFMATG